MYSLRTRTLRQSRCSVRCPPRIRICPWFPRAGVVRCPLRTADATALEVKCCVDSVFPRWGGSVPCPYQLSSTVSGKKTALYFPTLPCLFKGPTRVASLISCARFTINTSGIVIAVITLGALLMATEFPDDPEVDLGFRDPATKNSIPKSMEEWKPQMELSLDYEPPISKGHLSNRWWSLRITIILFLSAFGGLISSIFLFDHAERPSILKRWKRQAYIIPKTAEPLLVTANSDLRLDRLLSFQIEGDWSSFDDHPPLFQESDASISSIQQRPPFNAAVRLPLDALRFVLPGDFFMTQTSGRVLGPFRTCQPASWGREWPVKTAPTISPPRVAFCPGSQPSVSVGERNWVAGSATHRCET